MWYPEYLMVTRCHFWDSMEVSESSLQIYTNHARLKHTKMWRHLVTYSNYADLSHSKSRQVLFVIISVSYG